MYCTCDIPIQLNAFSLTCLFACLKFYNYISSIFRLVFVSQLAARYGMKFLEVSAEKNINVNQASVMKSPTAI